MVFEDSSQTATGSRYLGEGFRLEPDFREGGTTTAEDEEVGELEGAPVALKRSVTPNLDYVFDDPAHGEPGRDRMLVHGLWEFLLVVALVGVGYLLYRASNSAFSGDALRGLMLRAAVLGAFTLAAVVALRAAVPNLAIGALGAAAAIQFSSTSGGPAWPIVMVLGLCAAVGLVQGLVVVGLHVPGWAVGIGVALALLAWSSGHLRSVTSTYDPLPHAYYWFGGFCAVSILGGLITLVPSLRRAAGRFRPVADPAHRRGIVAAVIALVATVASSVLAGLGGVLMQASSGTAPAASAGLELTALAFGVALIGGTSAYGRRGGILGTVLAVALATVAIQYATTNGNSWSTPLIAAIAIGVGLAVTRLIERFGRPAPGSEDDSDDEDWAPQVHATSGRGWQSNPSTPAATTTTGGLWASDEAWGTIDQR